MRVRFWGVRGSIATPGPATLRYGGNTACVEVRSAKGTLVVIDCGTGAHGLGRQLMADCASGLRGHILISHTHWDHIQGLPFFAPLFVPGNLWDIHAPRGIAQSLRDTLAGQMQYTYFPVELGQLGAEIRYHELVEGMFDAGDIRVRTQYLNHTALTLGYRLEADGACLVYVSDHEPYARRLATGDEPPTGRDGHHAEFLAGADLVVHDAQYRAAEYPAKLGWGHSTFEYAAAVSHAGGARQLALFHHDPLRDDAALDGIVVDLRGEIGRKEWQLDVFAAAEGQAVELSGAPKDEASYADCEFPATNPPALGPDARSVLLVTADPSLGNGLAGALRADRTDVMVAADAATALAVVQRANPALVVLDEHLGDMSGLEVCRAIRELPGADRPELPVVLVAQEEDAAAGAAAGVSDWLVRPFSDLYARTRIRAWLPRMRCRWMRPPVPADEEQRLAALHRLRVLDTQPEERFDRLTRLAAALFEVPMALVSLLDRDRQCLKSTCGISVRQTTREVSCCGHAILRREVMGVPDTLLDDRFADNPYVTGEPRLRFYAGCPLVLEGGFPVGTLCILDTRPHQLDGPALRHLRDLAQLVERELAQQA